MRFARTNSIFTRAAAGCANGIPLAFPNEDLDALPSPPLLATLPPAALRWDFFDCFAFAGMTAYLPPHC